MTSLEKIIKEKGPILSSELLKTLTTGDNPISNEAARKRLTRIGDGIYRIRGLFADRQILFHDKEIFGTEVYYDGLHQALKKAGKQYYTILQALDFHNGYVKQSQLPAYSVNPVDNLKGHLNFETAFQNLLGIKLIHVEDEHVVLSTSISQNSHSIKRAKGIEVAKNFLLIQFSDWSRKIGLVSYNSSTFHSLFGNYQFNFVAPSYIASLTKRTKEAIVPAFVVADILIGNVINESQVNFFVTKIDALKQQKQLAKFIPFLIVDSIDTKALNSLKSKGIVIGFADELFGQNYKELLNSLINLVTNAGAILKRNPDAYLDLISKLNKLVDGKTNNLRGDLFELAVGYYHGRKCSNIDIGKSIIHSGERREIDVIGLQSNTIILSECKGYRNPVSKDEIETWLGEKVPVIRKWILDNAAYSGKDLIFQFWSTGGYSPEAKILLDERIRSSRRYKIEYFDLEQMLEMSKEINSKKFTEILREYYVKEM